MMVLVTPTESPSQRLPTEPQITESIWRIPGKVVYVSGSRVEILECLRRTWNPSKLLTVLWISTQLDTGHFRSFQIPCGKTIETNCGCGTQWIFNHFENANVNEELERRRTKAREVVERPYHVECWVLSDCQQLKEKSPCNTYTAWCFAEDQEKGSEEMEAGCKSASSLTFVADSHKLMIEVDKFRWRIWVGKGLLFYIRTASVLFDLWTMYLCLS
jgi:hypothetical protein